MMEKLLLPNGTPVLHQNRYCDQEDFEIIYSGECSEIEDSRVQPYYNGFKIKYPSFTHITTLIAHSNHNSKVLISCSSVWTTRIEEMENVDASRLSSESYDVRNNVVELSDPRIYYCACSHL